MDLVWRGAFTSSEANALHAEAFDTRVYPDDEWDWRGLAELRPFYIDTCGFTPTPAGLLSLEP